MNLQFKTISSYLAAGMIGGATFFGIQTMTQDKDVEVAKLQTPVATYTSTPLSGGNIPVDFVDACAIATKAVVSIEAAESEVLANERRQDRSQDLFNFDLEDFFRGGGPFGQGFFGPKKGSGSGVLISENGYIVTNNHVVGFADELTVTLQDGKEYAATRVGTDPSTDLAVIKIQGNGFNYLKLSDSDNVKVGQWVLAIGNPFNYLSSTVTAGIVSALGRDIDIIKNGNGKTIEEFIQTDAAINPGNSGGALVDVNGNLIGINTAIATPTGVYAGYSFAIPSNLVKQITDDIIANGDIDRANLGIAGYDIDAELVKSENLTVSSGVYVAEVVPGSGAQFSGVLPCDVITTIDGNDIENFEQMRQYLRFSKVGDVVKLNIIRDGKKKVLDVKIIKII